MSYNSRTEFNTAYDVTGDSRVRFALHPYDFSGKYGDDLQKWTEWQQLGSNRTYSLTEPADQAEHVEVDGEIRAFRNKHQISMKSGYVSHYCGFDPAPVGIEKHKAGAYSDYEPFEKVSATPEFQKFMAESERFDDMMNVLSLARALGKLDEMKSSKQY